MREQARRGGLAVGARHADHPLGTQHLPCEPLGTGRIGYAAVQNLLDNGHTARHDVTDDHDVRREIELLALIPLDYVDAERRQLIAHRRVNPLIGSSHPVPGGASERCDSGHKCAADTENMDMHDVFRDSDQRCSEPSVTG